MLLQRVRESGARDFSVRWRYFSLAQVNNHEAGWTIWDAAPDDPAARGRLAFQAAEAARRQDRFEDIHASLLEARHVEGRDIEDVTVVEDLSRRVGLDMDRFRSDVADPSVLLSLARDHREAVDELGVFGSPTFHFPGRGAAYVRVRPVPEGEAALRVFDQIGGITADEPYFLELKRSAHPPQAPAAASSRSAEARVARTSGPLRSGS